MCLIAVELRIIVQRSAWAIQVAQFGDRSAITSTMKSMCTFLFLSSGFSHCYCRCGSCLCLREAFSHLRSIIEQNKNIADEMRQRLLYRLEHNTQLITDWKKHLLRTVHQDVARKHTLDVLDETSLFIVADWAMKWLPTRYREAQRDFFGKRGLPWHVTYAIRAKPVSSSVRSMSSSSSSTSSSVTDDTSFEHRTFCHVFDNAKQDGRTVTSILSSVTIAYFPWRNSYID